MTDGCKMVTSQFIAVGGAGTHLQSIKGEGDDLYDFSIQTLDAAGRTAKAFGWNDWDFEDGAWADEDGNDVQFEHVVTVMHKNREFVCLIPIAGIDYGEDEDENTAKILFEELMEIYWEGKIYWER